MLPSGLGLGGGAWCLDLPMTDAVSATFLAGSSPHRAADPRGDLRPVGVLGEERTSVGTVGIADGGAPQIDRGGSKSAMAFRSPETWRRSGLRRAGQGTAPIAPGANGGAGVLDPGRALERRGDLVLGRECRRARRPRARLAFRSVGRAERPDHRADAGLESPLVQATRIARAKILVLRGSSTPMGAPCARAG